MARFNSEVRDGASLPIRFTSAERDTVRMLSQFATQRRGNPSVRPRGTSTAIRRTVEVISTATNLFKYAYALSRLNSKTGRRPAG